MKLRIRVGSGTMIPRFYGIAYIDWSMRGAICYPIPLNWIVGLGRHIWYGIKRGPRRAMCPLCRTLVQ